MWFIFFFLLMLLSSFLMALLLSNSTIVPPYFKPRYPPYLQTAMLTTNFFHCQPNLDQLLSCLYITINLKKLKLLFNFFFRVTLISLIYKHKRISNYCLVVIFFVLRNVFVILCILFVINIYIQKSYRFLY